MSAWLLEELEEEVLDSDEALDMLDRWLDGVLMSQKEGESCWL